MREPIHNRVAQEFLVQFLRRLGQYQDVHEALIAASQTLRLEKTLTFPSSALIPSLFCRPGQPLFRFRKFGWREWVRQLKPTRRQALAVAMVTGLSLLSPVQGVLLDQRQWSQAIYRRFTGQTMVTAPPSITMVQIDDKSIQEANIAEPYPMDRTYLAQLLDQITRLEASVVGIDYIFDRPAARPEDDQALANALQEAVAQGTWLVLPSLESDNGEWSPVLPGVDFATAPSHWSLIGDVQIWGHSRDQQVLPSYLRVPLAGSVEHHIPLPFAYSLALAAQIQEEAPEKAPQPDLQSQSSLMTQLGDYWQGQGEHYATQISERSHVSSITLFSFWLRQTWLHPIIDFSLPPGQVYRSIPAWQLLEPDAASTYNFQDMVVILAAGGYDEAGALPGEDNKDLPAAVRHWRFWKRDGATSLEIITGGEVHAYMVQNFLSQRLVVPVPDLWMVGVAALLGNATVLLGQNRGLSRRQGYLLLVGATAAYGVASLQLYISAAILLPWLLPSLTYWVYVLPVVNQFAPQDKRRLPRLA
jgi:CHASE2 domain-containing sensor protein